VSQAKKFASLLAFDDESKCNHPDIKVVESENLYTLGVDDIRDIISKDNLTPLEGRYKVVIFPPLKSLTEEASNALLKTIEEPAESTVFLILSAGVFWSHARDNSNNQILSTIKSRCRSIYLDTEIDLKFDYSSKDFVKFLDNQYVDSNLNFKKMLTLLSEWKNDIKDLSKAIQIINECKDIHEEIDEQSSITANTLIVKSISYLTNSLIYNSEITKQSFRDAEAIEKAMLDINLGMRPQTVFAKLSVEM
jgi:DNA polymerase III delta prime subunit